jgi:REP element-mobilizing transposase RayT/predicted transcriptional regulator
MARKKRMESIGFYHIVNRGVERRKIYMDDDDRMQFLEILQESAEVYNFEIYAYVLMDNHYHLLLKTSSLNLSLLMRQINSRYSMYFNRKYKRVGPLWQGRFKSWYVYDEQYLKSLVKYIEFNPIKANMTKNVGEFAWAMSSKRVEMKRLNYTLIESSNLKEKLSKKELQEVDNILHAKLEVVHKLIVPKIKKSLASHFKNTTREVAIAHAIEDGYTQQTIADYLGLSNISVSKTYKKYRQKVSLFNKLRDKGIFWSYSKEMSYEKAGESLLIEYLYKYADFDDIRLGFSLFGKRVMKRVWEEKLKSDKRFIKLNFMIARVFLGMDVEASYFKEVKNERFEKLKMLASRY